MEINCIEKNIDLNRSKIQGRCVDVWGERLSNLLQKTSKFYSHFLHILTRFVHLSLHYSSSGSNGLRETYITYKSLFKDI